MLEQERSAARPGSDAAEGSRSIPQRRSGRPVTGGPHASGGGTRAASLRAACGAGGARLDGAVRADPSAEDAGRRDPPSRDRARAAARARARALAPRHQARVQRRHSGGGGAAREPVPDRARHPGAGGAPPRSARAHAVRAACASAARVVTPPRNSKCSSLSREPWGSLEDRRALATVAAMYQRPGTRPGYSAANAGLRRASRTGEWVLELSSVIQQEMHAGTEVRQYRQTGACGTLPRAALSGP